MEEIDYALGHSKTFEDWTMEYWPDTTPEVLVASRAKRTEVHDMAMGLGLVLNQAGMYLNLSDLGAPLPNLVQLYNFEIASDTIRKVEAESSKLERRMEEMKIRSEQPNEVVPTQSKELVPAPRVMTPPAPQPDQHLVQRPPRGQKFKKSHPTHPQNDEPSLTPGQMIRGMTAAMRDLDIASRQANSLAQLREFEELAREQNLRADHLLEQARQRTQPSLRIPSYNSVNSNRLRFVLPAKKSRPSPYPKPSPAPKVLPVPVQTRDNVARMEARKEKSRRRNQRRREKKAAAGPQPGATQATTGWQQEVGVDAGMGTGTTAVEAAEKTGDVSMLDVASQAIQA